MQRSKNSDIWLPFSDIDKINKIIRYAYEEGLKLGWGNAYQPKPPLIYTRNSEEPAPDVHKEETEPFELVPIAVQDRLF